jgi:hypothetical protein
VAPMDVISVKSQDRLAKSEEPSPRNEACYRDDGFVSQSGRLSRSQRMSANRPYPAISMATIPRPASRWRFLAAAQRYFGVDATALTDKLFAPTKRVISK